MTIGDRLIAARGARKREDVCKACGISLSALTMYELNYRVPRDEIKIRLSKFFGIPVQELFYAD